MYRANMGPRGRMNGHRGFRSDIFLGIMGMIFFGWIIIAAIGSMIGACIMVLGSVFAWLARSGVFSPARALPSASSSAWSGTSGPTGETQRKPRRLKRPAKAPVPLTKRPCRRRSPKRRPAGPLTPESRNNGNGWESSHRESCPIERAAFSSVPLWFSCLYGIYCKKQRRISTVRKRTALIPVRTLPGPGMITIKNTDKEGVF